METATDRINTIDQAALSTAAGSDNAFAKVLRITGRALLGIYFILPGVMKVFGFEATSALMTAHQVPFVPVLLVLTIILQIGGGTMLAIGYRSAPVAFVLAGLTLVISVYMHNFWALEEGIERSHELQNFVKNLAIMAGLMFVAGTTKR